MDTADTWNAERGSVHPRIKRRKQEKDEHVVHGFMSSGFQGDVQDLISPAGNYYQHVTFNEQGDLADDDGICYDIINSTGEKKRGLTVDQVKYLEMNFTMDFKLEPERKALIAKELGLRPRQVAIWFQNRRARWKNKQLEQDYETLKSSYEALLQENEDMVKRNKALDEENKLLQAEIARLTGISGNVDVPVDIDAKVASPDLDSDSDLESTVKGEKQQNLKSEIGIPAKLDAQSEILESLTLSCLKSQEAIVAFVEQPIGANDSVVACATVKIEAGYLSPSEETFINYPQLVHGFHVDDVLFTYENQPYGFTWDVW